MHEFEDRQPRLGAPAAAAMLASVLLAAAISYNALWRQSPHDKSSLIPGLASREPATQGLTRMVVKLDQQRPTTVTLRYDPVVESVQRELAASGLYDGPVDGVSGKHTELAILAYQHQSQLDETGTATQELVDHIALTRQFTQAADTTASLPPAPARARAPPMTKKASGAGPPGRKSRSMPRSSTHSSPGCNGSIPTSGSSRSTTAREPADCRSPATAERYFASARPLRSSLTT